ncbi:MAG: transcription elongation factor GreA [Firmicutes bacterium]|nr:transcription elongation factor GreA [Bacillota bacterium]
MEKKQTYVSEEGLKKLKDEYDYLKVTRRQEVAAALKQAKAFGDLSENSEYDEAKNEQAEVEGRIAELEELLANVKLIDGTEKSATVSVGSVVKVKDNSLKQEFTYTIVGATESDPFNDKISDESPIGAALLGKKPGQTVSAETPAGIVKLKILEIL